MDIKQITEKYEAYVNGKHYGEKTAQKDIFQLLYEMTKKYQKIELDAEFIKVMANIYKVDLDA